jgi:uncharacterized protein (DUF885 family)
MGWIKKSLLGLGGAVVLAGLGGYVWFWGKPVGVNNYINKATLKIVADSPEILTYMGMIDNTPLDFHSGKLASYTQAQMKESLEKTIKARKNLDKYGPEGLDGQELLSWKITAWFLDDLIRQGELEYSDYPVNQISGPTVDLPQFLTDTHSIKNKKSVERFLSRVEEFGRVLDEVKTQVEDHRDNGVVAPDFIIEKSLIGMRRFIEGGAEANPLVNTLPRRLEAVEGLSQAKKEGYVARTKALVETEVIPGYKALIALHEDLLKIATHDAGIWRLPNGDKIYAAALKSNTTTDFTPDQIHQTGLSEVARIEGEMEAILFSQGLTEGTITERIQGLMSDPQYIFANTNEGREKLLAYLVELNEDVLSKAGDYFVTLPPQPLEIVRVPEYSQDSAPGGYYSGPALDGSRPGRFYINLKDTADNPKWTLPTLLYHEAAPGHHFQISRGMMVEDVPILRKMGPFNAFAEGWALYAERIAAEDMGLYDEDPLGDLGRLQAEMFRAVRLVVDTGLHDKKWSREKAIAYMMDKTGNTEAEVTREIERYVVWPGQATAYKTGQLAILDMRARAEEALGEAFNLRQFNELLLKNGAMPLRILDDVVDQWIAEQKL